MRVVHVNDIASVGSALVAGLRAQGVDADLLDPARFAAGLRYPLRAAGLPFRSAALAVAAIRLRLMRADLVHVHYARLGFLGPLGGRPYVLHCHGTDLRGISPRQAWGRAVSPWLRRAACVLYATPDLEPWVRAFRPDARYLPNPIALPVPADPTGPRRDLLIGVRLDPIKGPGQIAAVTGELMRGRPGTTVTIIARGSALAAVRRVAGSHAELVPAVAHPAMAGLFARHRVAIGQMAVGAIGNYELEAMASGLPVAAGFRYPDAYGEPPPLVGGSDPAEVARQLAKLLDDEPERARIGAEARRWVGREHGVEAITRRVRAIYAEIIGSGLPDATAG